MLTDFRNSLGDFYTVFDSERSCLIGSPCTCRVHFVTVFAVRASVADGTITEVAEHTINARSVASTRLVHAVIDLCNSINDTAFISLISSHLTSVRVYYVSRDLISFLRCDWSQPERTVRRLWDDDFQTKWFLT